MKDTNYHLLGNLLNNYRPKERGIIAPEESLLITTELQLNGATEIELRNMRDFVVLYIDSLCESNEENIRNEIVYMDMMSAITFVIDNALMNLGCEV